MPQYYFKYDIFIRFSTFSNILFYSYAFFYVSRSEVDSINMQGLVNLEPNREKES